MIPSNDSIDATFSFSWTHRLRFTDDSFSQGSSLNEALHDLSPVQILTVVDSGVQKCNSAFMKSFSAWQKTLTTPNCGPIVIEGGETTKNNMDSVGQVLTAINDNNLCRKSCVLVVGGGALLDAVGFASSTAHRGIPIIRMPSTTLAQCDSGVGVKNAVNYFG